MKTPILVKVKTNELQSNEKGIVWTLQQSSFLYSYHSGMEFLVVKLKTFDATILWKAVALLYIAGRDHCTKVVEGHFLWKCPKWWNMRLTLPKEY